MSKVTTVIVCCFACVLLLCHVGGCKKKEILSSVSGKVTYNGKPFSDGSVRFINPQTGVSGIAYMDAGGNYEFVSPIPIGDYQVAIGGYAPLPPGEVDKRKMPRYPEKYKNPTSSGWTFTIVEGVNIKDFDMTD